MAESYPLTMPIGNISRISLTGRSMISTTTSEFTFAQQVYRHQGEMWEADITLSPMKRENAEAWISFLLRLRGQYGTFLLGDPNGGTPRGSASILEGNPVINGIGQTGDSLNIGGLPVSTTGYLKAGDYIQLRTGADATLHKVLEDVDSDASGEATLSVFPSVRSAPANGQSVVVSNAKGNFRLNVNVVNWDISTVATYGITFGAVEAV